MEKFLLKKTPNFKITQNTQVWKDLHFRCKIQQKMVKNGKGRLLHTEISGKHQKEEFKNGFETEEEKKTPNTVENIKNEETEKNPHLTKLEDWIESHSQVFEHGYLYIYFFFSKVNGLVQMYMLYNDVSTSCTMLYVHVVQ